MNDLAGTLAAAFPFWQQLSVADKDAVMQSCVERKYEKKEIVHRSQERCKGALLLLSGQLRVFIVSEEGREVTLFRIRAGESCVLSASCLLDAITFDVLIESTERTKALVIPAQLLHEIMEHNAYVGLYLYKTATERFSDVMWTMQQILFLGADRRVAHFLWEEAARQGQILTFTHEEIARYIGSAREVVTKTLNYLAEEGAVQLGRGKIKILNKEQLKNFL